MSAQTLDSGFNANVDMGVYALVAQPDGKVVAGGAFTLLDGQACAHVGRLNPDGTLDPGFNPGADNYVYSLVLQPDGKLLAAGMFSQLSGQNQSFVGRLNADGTLDSSFAPLLDGPVLCLALQPDGQVILGGNFNHAGGLARSCLARVNAAGVVDSAFAPQAGSVVRTLAVQPDGKILVGGGFLFMGAQICNFLCRLNADGTLDTNFVAGANNWVYSLTLAPDGKILAGGLFTSMNGLPRNHLARLNPDGTLDPTFSSTAGPGGTYNYVDEVLLQTDGKIIVGGLFGDLGGQARGYLGRLNGDGTLDTSFTPPAGSEASALALQHDAKLLAGGWGYLQRFNNTSSPTESLTSSTAANLTTINWQRDGTGPEVWRTTFESSTNGTNWSVLGAGTRNADVWQLGPVSVPTNGYVRARGFLTSGYQDSSGGFVESVLGPALFLSQPASRTNDAGTTATFTVAAEGSPPLVYSWRKNGLPLIDAGNVSGSSTSTLTLSNVLHADAAGYSVVVSNRFGPATSSVAALTVHEPVITSQPAALFLDAGQTAQFAVMAVGTAPSYQWWRNGASLSGATASTLLLTNVQGTDSGSFFQVVVSTAFGSVTSAVATLTVNVATADAFAPAANYPVRSLAVQTDGKVLLSGYFSQVNGQFASGIARINPDGTLDATFGGSLLGIPFSPALPVVALQEDGSVLIAGGISSLDDLGRAQIGRFNQDGSVDATFNPGAHDSIFAMVVQQDGKVIVGGVFTNLAGLPCAGLGRLNPDGTADTNFNSGAGGAVYSLALQADGRILVGGGFTNLAGQSLTNLGRLNPDGSIDSGFSPNPNGAVNALAVEADGSIVLGGAFTALGSQPRNYVARLSSSGVLDANFNPGPDGPVNCFALETDGKIVLGGAFANLGAQPRNHLARLNPDGSLDMTFNPDADGAVNALAIELGGKLLVAGSFATLDGQPRGNLGRVMLEPATQSLANTGTAVTWLRGGTSPELWRAFVDVSTNGAGFVRWAAARISGGWQVSGLNLPANATVRARGQVAGSSDGSSWFAESIIGPLLITSQPADSTNNLYTTAHFSVGVVGESPMTFQWLKNGQALADGGNISGSQASALSVADVTGIDGGSYSVVVSNSWGSITSRLASLVVFDPVITNNPVNQAAALGQTASFSVAADGTQPFSYQWRKDGTFISGATTATLSLANIQATDIGSYDVIVGNAFGSVTSLTATLTVNLAMPDPLNPGPNNSVYALAVQPDAKILVGGAFNTLAGQPRNYLGRLNPDGSLDVTFNPNANGNVLALAVATNGAVLAGGSFTMVSGVNQPNLVRLNPDGTVDTGFKPMFNGWVRCIAIQPDGAILVGGDFSAIGGVARSRLARLFADGTVDPAFNPGADLSVSALALQTDGKLLVGGGFLNLAGQPRSVLGRLNPDGSLDAGFNPGQGGWIFSLLVQPDGRILAGGSFSSLGGLMRNFIARLNPDGSADPQFNPGPENPPSCSPCPEVTCLALQANGRILVGGYFNAMGGSPRTNLARLNPDGSPDLSFNPGGGWLNALLVQGDGGIVVGGSFGTLAGQSRGNLGRLVNTDVAADSLTFNPSNITWLRAGGETEVWRATFDASADGVTWLPFGEGVRTAGGWQASGLALGSAALVRARGFVAGGPWFIESIGGAPFFTAQPVSQTNNALTTALFSATALGTAPMSYQWLKNGLPISNGGTISGATSPALTLSNVLGPDAGLYSLVAANSMGTTTSAVARLTVLDPLLTSQPASLVTNAGQTVAFAVTAIGSAPFSFQWFKDGVALSDGGNLSGAQSPTLLLSNALGGNAGSYQLVLTNLWGAQTSAVATLTVLDPVILTNPLSQSAQAGQAITLSVAVAGTTPLSFQWRKNAAPLPGATAASLVFTNIQGSDTGNYDVIVTNVFGVRTSLVASVTVNSAVLDSFNPGAKYQVNCLMPLPDGKVLAAGTFSPLGSQSGPVLLRLNPDGTIDSSFNPPTNTTVYAVALESDGKLLVSALSRQLTTYLSRLNLDGTIDASFSAGLNAPAFSILPLPDGNILVGGAFSSVSLKSQGRVARLFPNGTLDTNFTASVQDGTVSSLALQADGNILVGGTFTSVSGVARTNLCRLTPNGAVDLSFIGSATLSLGQNTMISCLALQADGKLLVGGNFTALDNQPRNRLGRLNPDGSLDTGFNPGAGSTVSSFALETSGNIIVAGTFTNLAGTARSRLGRLAPDGTLDPFFNPNVNGSVLSLALQTNGAVLLGGIFTTVAGQSRTNIARLLNPDPATQTLTSLTGALLWWRGGSSPEVWRASFEASTDGTNWLALGDGARVTGGWRLNNPLPGPGAFVRARGFLSGGLNDGSSVYVEARFIPPTLFGFGVQANQFTANVAAAVGQVVVLETSFDLTSWTPIQTNVIPAAGFVPFSDPAPGQFPHRFYRARLQ
jgi:uncharacterized delta-60 repeat protein